MFGIIVIGHGGFASGLAKNIKMLSGENITAIDFTEEITPEDLDKKILDAIETFNQLNQIIIFTDIPGGTPYNRSVMVGVSNPKIRIIAGTNVPMLLDAVLKNMNEMSFDNIDDLVKQLMDTAKEGIVKFEMPESIENKDAEEDGI